MSFDVISTTYFQKQTKRLKKKYPSLINNLLELTESLSQNPQQGESLGKDCYKIRIAITSKGRGKSGGARVITSVKIIGKRVYLLSIYDKSERESIDDKEIDLLLKLAGLIK